MPVHENFDDCHVINAVYLTDTKKWVWMDATFEVYLTDEDDNLLGIDEVRMKLIRDEKIIISECINWNGKPYPGDKNTYLHEYMTKNLYRMSAPISSEAGYESGVRKRIYIELVPETHENFKDYKKYENVDIEMYFTKDDKLFWQEP